MKDEMLQFISNSGLVPFKGVSKSTHIMPEIHVGESKSESIFKTKEARAVFRRIRDRVAAECVFEDSISVLSRFEPVADAQVIAERRVFFDSIPTVSPVFLRKLREPRANWKLPYQAIIAVADERLYSRLKARKLPVLLLQQRGELRSLEKYAVVYTIKGDEVSSWAREMDCAVEVGEEVVYPEQYVEELALWSGVVHDLILHRDEVGRIDAELVVLLDQYSSALSIFGAGGEDKKPISRAELEKVCLELNASVRVQVKSLTLQGDALVAALSSGTMPAEIKQIISRSIAGCGHSRALFVEALPITIDEKEFERERGRLVQQGIDSFVRQLKTHATLLSGVPAFVERLQTFLVYADFVCALRASFDGSHAELGVGKGLLMDECSNMFLEKPEPITFFLDSQIKCSIMTGANSGGKTTLLEHIIQTITLAQMGLPIRGRVGIGVFDSVYYFAKNKGSTSKGAFETMLTQLAGISGGMGTLILADEMEAVTEPGVAAHIIASTCSYFMSKGCYLVIATHLGEEIITHLPSGARVDGISASGLDADMNLMVCHNPVLGQLANSTPELIVERLATLKKKEYFIHLHTQLKSISKEKIKK